MSMRLATRTPSPKARRVGAIVLLFCGVGIYVLACAGAAIFALPALGTDRGGAGYLEDFWAILRFLGGFFSVGVIALTIFGVVLAARSRAWVVCGLNTVLCALALAMFIWVISGA